MKVYIIKKSPILINGQLNTSPQYESTKFEYDDIYKTVDKLHQLYKDFPDYYYIVKEIFKE